MSGPIRRRVRVTARDELTRDEAGWLKRGITPCPFPSEAAALAAWEANRDGLTAECARSGYVPYAAVLWDGSDGPVHPYRKLLEEANRAGSR